MKSLSLPAWSNLSSGYDASNGIWFPRFDHLKLAHTPFVRQIYIDETVGHSKEPEMIKLTGHYSCPQPCVILSGGTRVATTAR